MMNGDESAHKQIILLNFKKYLIDWKKSAYLMPLYYRGAKQYRNRGDYNGKYQPLQLYRRVAADDY